jgi:hypothetical protein
MKHLMEKINNKSKRIKRILIVTALTMLTINFSYANTENEANREPKIQLAILLDASSSMDGLIDQAKARLWNIVNTLTALRYNGEEPVIEIALYKYGHSDLAERDNYIKQLLAFTGDLDLLSEKLFSIKTYGGLEYCGAVIEHSVSNLQWCAHKNSMKLIFIAGNEPFNQGKINYIEAVVGARQKNIFINTIYCGNCEFGVRELWKDGADKGKGNYFCINSNEKISFIATPYDVMISEQNEALNKTYIYYGEYGQSGYMNQAKQDKNAQSVSGANYVERAVSKSQTIYRNDSWDLVDKHKTESDFYKTVEKSTLPKEYQKLTDAQLKAILDAQVKQREEIQQNIAKLNKQRQEYINNNSSATKTQDDFGQAVNLSIKTVAKAKGFQ